MPASQLEEAERFQAFENWTEETPNRWCFWRSRIDSQSSREQLCALRQAARSV
jgi:hypothetical protein